MFLKTEGKFFLHSDICSTLITHDMQKYTLKFTFFDRHFGQEDSEMNGIKHIHL